MSSFFAIAFAVFLSPFFPMIIKKSPKYRSISGIFFFYKATASPVLVQQSSTQTFAVSSTAKTG